MGINTDVPKQKLDIGGTFGFSQPGEIPNSSTITDESRYPFLAWNKDKSKEKTDTNTDQGKLVALVNVNDKPLKKK